jgi:hypothetical protein
MTAQEKSIYNKIYRQAHLKTIAAKNKAWRLANKEKLAAYEKTRIRPALTEAQKEKRRIYARLWDKTAAGKKKKARNDRAYFLKHKPKVYMRMRRFYDAKRDILDRLKNKPCADCYGWFEPCQMDFDHRNPKEKRNNVGELRNHRRKLLLEEIAKCDLVCSNCHRLRTYNRGQHDSKTSGIRYLSRHSLPSMSAIHKTRV